ncbi:MAG TPA: LamG-like jellyroll fold domain-containing protein, partial [Elainellaceae cyanobacterium]
SDLTLRRGGRVETRTQGFIPSRLASQVADDSYTDLVQADDPAAYWPLDDAAGETTVADRGGDRFDGTIEGTVLLGQPGVSGTGAALDGDEGAINIGQVETESALGFAERSFTVEAWVNPNADPPDQQVFFGVHDENDRRESLHLRLNDDGSIRAGFFADDLDTPDDTLRFGDGWYHVVTRYDQPTDTTSVFVNGTLAGVGSDGPYQGENPTVRIGNWRSPTDQTFNGSIDEVAVYTMPLSLDRIAAHYFRGQQNLGNALNFQVNQDANAGNIRVNADSITISGISSTQDRSSGLLSGTEGQASGRGGNIAVITDRLRVSDGGVLSARTLNSSSGGAIAIDANTLTLTDGGQILTTTLASGDAGQISVTGDRIRLSGEAQSISSENEGSTSLISARTQGAGNAGSIEMNGNQLVIQNRAELSASTSGAGRGGDIDLNVQELTVRGGGRVSASTSGDGQGGAIQIQGAELVRLQGARDDERSSGIFTTTEASAGDRGGRIFIDAQDLQILDQAVISARTRSPFRGGSVRIASDTVELSNGGQIVTTASNQGDAGDIRVDARDAIQIAGQAALATTDTDGVASGLFASTQQAGDAGNIIVSAGQFDAIAGGRIATSTAGEGDAGDINLFVSDRITLSDSQSGLFADTSQGSSGDGGSILVDPQTLRVQNGAGIAVSSRGRGVGGDITVQGEAIFLDNGGFISADNDGISQGGDIQIQGDRLFLDNRSFISAETASSQGGNIDLSFEDIVALRRGSSISTDAGTSRRADANGDGGNISIATGFVVAVPSENSDISANATRGNGGSVGITAEGIFGIQFRDEESPLSDITVSSEFGTDGIVVIDTLDVDPSRGLTDLPSEPVDPQLNQSCQPQGDSSTGRFVDAGRGGLPPTPGDTAIGQTWDDMRSPDAVDETSEETGDRTVQSSSSTAMSIEIPSEIEEAQGWTVDETGRVILTADTSHITPYSSWQTPTRCGQ